MQIFHELEIASVKPNTKNAVLVEFAIPESLKNKYQFKPGQNVLIDFYIERNNYRRTYSICSAPQEKKLCISVKRQYRGIISNYINDAFFNGLRVKVSEPYGDFYADEQIIDASMVILWAGGSGITPMISITKHILSAFPNKSVQLIYANNNDKSIMFENDIQNLKIKHTDFFLVTQILSNNDGANNSIFKLFSFSSAKKEWKGLKGYITNEFVKNIIAKHPNAVHYICGPEKMMEICESALQHKDAAAIYLERFSGASSVNNSNKNAVLKVNLHKKEYEINVAENNLLDAMLATKLNPPYACKTGTCGSCKATLVSGEVVMARDFALNQADREAGKILCCQTWAKSDTIAIEF